MKKDIHPNYELAIVRCACGNEVEVRTTAPGINVEICANCHPFFTGKQKLVDSAGRVDRFRKRYGLKDETSTAEAVAVARKARQERKERADKKKRTKIRPAEPPVVKAAAKAERAAEEKPAPKKARAKAEKGVTAKPAPKKANAKPEKTPGENAAP